MAKTCGHCAGEELPQAESILSARTSSWDGWLHTHSSFEVEQPTSTPSELPPLSWVMVTLLLAFHICVNPSQGVPLESPISQLSSANPASEGRSSLQACSCWNTHQGLCITSCHCHTGRGQCQGTRQAQLHGLALAWWGRGGSQCVIFLSHSQQNGSRTQLSTTVQYCRQVCWQARKHLPFKICFE